MTRRRRRDRPTGSDGSETSPAPSGTPPSLLAPGLAVVAAVTALVVAAALRLRGLGAPGLWTDELVSWWAASAPGIGGVLRRASTCMATPPLSFLPQHLAVSALGKSEWAMRLPSALAGIATVALVWAAGRRLLGGWPAVVAALLVALHPFHLWYSTDARPYALAMAFAAGLTWSFGEMLRGGARGAMVSYAVCAAGLVGSQFIFLPLLAVHTAIFAALRWRRAVPDRAAGRFGLALGGGLVLSTPVLPQLWRVGARSADLTWAEMSTGGYPPGIYGLLQTTPLVTGFLVVLILSLLRAGPGWRARHPDEPADANNQALSVAASFLVPLLVLGAAAAWLDLPTLVRPRYAAAYLIPGALLTAWMVTRPTWVAGRATFTGIYLALVVGSGVLPALQQGASFNQNAGVEDWAGAMRYVEANRQPGDLILARTGLVEVRSYYAGRFPEDCAGYLAAPVGDFYGTPSAEAVLLPPEFEPDRQPAAYRARIAEPAAGRQRIWLVVLPPPDGTDYLRPLFSYLQQVTGNPLSPDRVEAFGEIQVALLTARRDGSGSR